MRSNDAAGGTTYTVIQPCQTVTDAKALARLARGDDVPADKLGLRSFSVGDTIRAGELPDATIASMLENRCIAPRAEAEAAQALLVAEYGALREVSEVPGQSAWIGVPLLNDQVAAMAAAIAVDAPAPNELGASEPAPAPAPEAVAPVGEVVISG